MGIDKLLQMAATLRGLSKRAAPKDEDFDYEDPLQHDKDDRDRLFSSDEEVDLEQLLQAPKEEYMELLQATNPSLTSKEASLEAEQILNSIKQTFGEQGSQVEDVMAIDAVADLSKNIKRKKSKKESKAKLADAYTQRLYDTLNDPDLATSFLKTIFGSYIPTALIRKHLKLGMKRTLQVDPQTEQPVLDEQGKPRFTWQVTNDFTDWQNNGKYDPLFQEFFAQLYKSVGALALSGTYRIMARKMAKEGLSQVSDSDFSVSAIVNSILYGIKADDPLTRPEQDQLEKREKYRQDQGDNFLGDMDDVTFEGWLSAKNLSEDQKVAERKKRAEQKQALDKSSIADQSSSLLAKIQSYVVHTPKGRCSACQNSMWAVSNPLFPNATPSIFNNEILPRVKQGLLDESVVQQWRSNPYDTVNNIDLGVEGSICGGLFAEGKNNLEDIINIIKDSDARVRALSLRKDKVVTITLPDVEPRIAEQRAEALNEAKQNREEVSFDVQYSTKQYVVAREDFEKIKHFFCGASKKTSKDFKESRPLYRDVTSSMSSVMSRLVRTDPKKATGLVEEFRCPSVQLADGVYLTPDQAKEESVAETNQEINISPIEVKGSCSGILHKDFPAGQVLEDMARRYKVSEKEILERFEDEYVQCPVCTYWYIVRDLKQYAKDTNTKQKTRSKSVQTLELDKPIGDSEGKNETFVSTIPAPKSELEQEQEISELQAIRSAINQHMQNKEIPISLDGETLTVRIDNLGDHFVDLFSIEREGSTGYRSATDILNDLKSKSSLFMPIAYAMGFVAPFTVCNVCSNYQIGEKYACDKALPSADFSKLTMKAAASKIEQLESVDEKTKKHLPNFADWKKAWDSAKNDVKAELLYSLPLVKANLYPTNGCLNTKLGQAIFAHHFAVVAASQDEDDFSFFDEELLSKKQEPAKKAPAPSSSMFDEEDEIVSQPLLTKPKTPDKPTIKPNDRVYQPLDSSELVENVKASFESALWKDTSHVLSETERARVTGTNQTYYPPKTPVEKIDEKHVEYLKTLQPQLKDIKAIVNSPLDAVEQVLQYIIKNHSDLITRHV